MAIRSVALAGMISDTSLYNIDGACAFGGNNNIRAQAGTFVGVIVNNPVDGYKVVVPPSLSDTLVKPYGVVVRSHYETPDGQTRGLEAVNVMTHGRIWVRTTLTNEPDFGGKVFVNASGVVVEKTAGTTWETGFTFAGGFLSGYVSGSDPIKQGESYDGALVEVQLTQSADSTVAA